MTSVVEGPTEPAIESTRIERRDTCPGCGGRNEASADTCEWCGRPFDAQPNKVPRAIVGWSVIGFVVLMIGLAVVLTVATVVGRIVSQSATPANAPAVPETAVPRAEPSTDSGEAAASGPEYVRIGNTEKQGAYIRTEPRDDAQRIGPALPDRSILLIIGPDRPDQLVGRRTWRNVQDQTGRQGWMRADFLAASDVGF